MLTMPAALPDLRAVIPNHALKTIGVEKRLRFNRLLRTELRIPFRTRFRRIQIPVRVGHGETPCVLAQHSELGVDQIRRTRSPAEAQNFDTLIDQQVGLLRRLEFTPRGIQIRCRSMDRLVQRAGFLPTQLRKIESDENFQLPLARLNAQIAADRVAGFKPFAIVANAGTTNTGAIDPLPEIAALCAENQMWMHVDGAYGAPAALIDRGRAQLQGLELAHSLSLDPHKWLFQSTECGCVLLRDAQILKATYRIMPEYLAEVHRNLAEVNPCDYGIQLTRSFRALKLWMSIQYFGLDAFRAAMERSFALAALAEATLRSMPGWEIVTPAQMGIVTFHHPRADYKKIHEAMLKDGFALATSTVLKGRTVLRFCTVNPRTTDADIAETIRYLDELVQSSSNLQ
jgi:glutamate/tyrosine decarboxylase-like PLP-dependent enzyme